MEAYDKTSIQINRCKRILALVDTYVETETASARTDLRKALMEEFEAPAIAPPVAAESVDTEEFSALAARYGNSKAGKDYMALVANAAAWGAQQREAEKLKVEQSVVLAVDQAHQQAKDAKDLANELRQRAEKAEANYKIVCDKNRILRKYAEEHQAISDKWQGKAEDALARVKELEAGRQALQAEGKHPAPCASSCEARAFQKQVRERDARIEELEAQLVRRRAPLFPETQQAIAAARAAGQSIASTSGGLVFMNDGAEPDSGELDCPACGGSGHAGDAAAGSVA